MTRKCKPVTIDTCTCVSALLQRIADAQSLLSLDPRAFEAYYNELAVDEKSDDTIEFGVYTLAWGIAQRAMASTPPVKGTVPDSPVGFDRAPDRYTTKGRETIDRIRDELGDDGFLAFCIGTEMRYEDRAGLKGPREEDEAKARRYRLMMQHVQGAGPDPRSERPDFVPYKRPTKKEGK